jgi:hypothetical protein
MPYSDVVVGQNVELDFAHLANEYTDAYLSILQQVGSGKQRLKNADESYQQARKNVLTCLNVTENELDENVRTSTPSRPQSQQASQPTQTTSPSRDPKTEMGAGMGSLFAVDINAGGDQCAAPGRLRSPPSSKKVCSPYATTSKEFYSKPERKEFYSKPESFKGGNRLAQQGKPAVASSANELAFTACKAVSSSNALATCRPVWSRAVQHNGKHMLFEVFSSADAALEVKAVSVTEGNKEYRWTLSAAKLRQEFGQAQAWEGDDSFFERLSARLPTGDAHDVLQVSQDVAHDVLQVSQDVAVANAVIKLQAHVRRTRVRKEMLAHADASDTILAMPGTVQGSSGWYEFESSGISLVVKYRVTGDRQWVLDKGPMKKNVYYEAVNIVRRRQGKAPIAPNERKRSDFSAGVAVIGAVVKVQACVRRKKARKRVMAMVQKQGGTLAMPGTIQGKGGWYQYVGGQGVTNFVKFDIAGTSPNENWEMIEGPFTKVERDQHGGYRQVKADSQWHRELYKDTLYKDTAAPAKQDIFQSLPLPAIGATAVPSAPAPRAQAGALQGRHVMGLMGAASAEKPSTHQAAASAAPADDMFSIEADSAGDQSAAPDTSAQPEAKAKAKGAKKNDAKAEVAHRLPPRQRAAQRRVWQMEVEVNAKKDAETAKEEKSEAETVKKGAEERAKKEAEGKAKAKEAEEEEEAKKKKIHLISWGAVKFQANWRRIQARTAMIAHAAEQNTLLSMPGTIQGRSGWYEFDEKGERFVVAYNVTEAGAWEVQKGPMKKNFWLEAKQLKAESTGN